MALTEIPDTIYIFILVPKYENEYEWGGVFAMNPQVKTLSDAEYTEMVEKYRKALA